MEVKVSHSVVSDSLWPYGLYSPWNSPGQNTGVGSLSVLQGIFPTQGSNSGLLHCRQILYHLSHKRSPWILEWVACPISSGSSQPRNRTGVSCIADEFFTNCAISSSSGIHGSGRWWELEFFLVPGNSSRRKLLVCFFLEGCILILLLKCCRKQASLWIEGDYFRQKLRGQENGKHRAAVSKLLLAVDDISINGVENQDKQEPELVIEPPPSRCCHCFKCCWEGFRAWRKL